MQIDYTAVFHSPGHLADFLMLSNAEQIKLLAQYASQSAQLQLLCHLNPEKPCPTLPYK